MSDPPVTVGGFSPPAPTRPDSTQAHDGPVWYRSLYWRIAIGFIGFLAVLLLAQSLLFVWLAGRVGGLFPATSNARLAELIASDLREELERDPALDLAGHISREYGRVIQPFIVVMLDGRGVTNREAVPPALVRNARILLQRMAAGRARARPRRAQGPGGPGFFAPVVANGDVVGVVAVSPGPPPVLGALPVLGPMMAVSGVVLLCIGAAAASFLIVGPVRRRLEQLGAAALRIGAGDTTARAPERGRDEVAALAGAFNRMAADLHTRAEALAASDRARRQLLADVSHELMTPLTAMRGYLETLGMSELHLDGPTRERYLRIIEEETRRLEHIVGDLLDLARLEGGGATLRREAVSVDALFARVAERHERELRERRITLVRHVAEDADRFLGDPDRFEQALQNLAANALRHTPDGGRISLNADRIPSDARSTATNEEPPIRITVHDTGPGIPAEHLPLIFDRFYKADAARASAGSGLGLSIVKTIIEAHGGTITAKNADGALFEIVLPFEISRKAA